MYREKYQHIEYQIDIIKFIMMYTYIWYTFDVVDIDISSINLVKHYIV
jgi:hypothetical protein